MYKNVKKKTSCGIHPMINCCQENHSKNTKRLNHPSAEKTKQNKKTTGFCLPRFRNRLKPKYGKDIY